MNAPEASLLDAHTHLASLRYLPTAFLAGIAKNIALQSLLAPAPLSKERALARLIEAYSDPDGTRHLHHMEQIGADQAVLLLPDFTVAFPGMELTIAEMLDEHLAFMRRHPNRYLLFLGVDPRWEKDGVDLFARAAAAGRISGMKLYPPCGYAPDDRLLNPFYEICEAYRLPVLLHIGPTSPALSFTHAHPRYLDRPARDFPDVSFILAHGAVNHAEDCFLLCRYRPNVYMDLSGAQPLLADGGLIRLLDAGIAHKLIFGTDWPINSQAKANLAMVEAIRHWGQASATQTRAAQLILGGTIRRLLAAIRLAEPAVAG